MNYLNPDLLPVLLFFIIGVARLLKKKKSKRQANVSSPSSAHTGIKPPPSVEIARSHRPQRSFPVAQFVSSKPPLNDKVSETDMHPITQCFFDSSDVYLDRRLLLLSEIFKRPYQDDF